MAKQKAEAATQKKTVQYRVTPFQHIVVGDGAVVIALDHPNLPEPAAAYTSEVLSYDTDTGTFETKNTIYVVEATPPAQPEA